MANEEEGKKGVENIPMVLEETCLEKMTERQQRDDGGTYSPDLKNSQKVNNLTEEGTSDDNTVLESKSTTLEEPPFRSSVAQQVKSPSKMLTPFMEC